MTICNCAGNNIVLISRIMIMGQVFELELLSY